jgi:enoyl-CoA hydratase
MEYKDIKVTKENKVGTITIDRPEVLNAIRDNTMWEIEDILNIWESDPDVSVIVLTGAGKKAFISGGDIAIMGADKGYISILSSLPKGQAITSKIENYPKPVIAKINGIALGGGTEMALSCDIRIAADTAIMGVPEITLGIIPGYGGTQRLTRLVGLGMAKKMVLTGDHIKAAEAFRIGLVEEVVPAVELDDAVAKLAAKLALRPPVALRMGKEAINNGAQTDLRTGLEIEAKCFALCFGTEDKQEGMDAFLQKRKPNFKGR